MVNHYTADRKVRSDDAYTPGGVLHKRPDRAVLVYSQRCREAYSKTPIIIGGMEASLRRAAHYDYWVEIADHDDITAIVDFYDKAEAALVELEKTTPEHVSRRRRDEHIKEKLEVMRQERMYTLFQLLQQKTEAFEQISAETDVFFARIDLKQKEFLALFEHPVAFESGFSMGKK